MFDNDETVIITGKCLCKSSNESIKVLREFRTIITRNIQELTLVSRHEGDFIFMSSEDVMNYRIETYIYGSTVTVMPSDHMMTDPENTIHVDLPKDVIKMAMLVLHLDI